MTRSSADLAAGAWADVQEPLDRQLSPLGLLAIKALSLNRGDMVLDIGCGAGQTVLQIAGRIGRQGRVTGIDISPVLLSIARQRAREIPQANFIEADAQHLDLPSDSVDAVFSRFGVMAFDDPQQAFCTFRRVLKPSGRIAFVCWRSLAENQLDHLPLRAAGLEDRADSTPFSLAQEHRLRAILEAAGFQNIVVEAQDRGVSCGDIEKTLDVVLKVGPLGRVLRENPALQAAAEPRVRSALAERGGDLIVLKAAVWIVSAQA